MGIAHGAFCVGCCWSFMLVMFGVGLGSVTAMLALGGLTAIEKNLPWGRRLTRPLGIVLILAAVYALAGVTPASYARPRGRRPTAGSRTRAERRGRATADTRARDPRRGAEPACCATATPTSRPAASPRRPASRSARSTTTSASKQQLILAMLEAENERLLERQRRDVRRPGAAVAALGAGLRLPRRGPRVRATSGSSRR